MQAVVVYAHGLNEHSGRFSRFAAELVAHGFAVTSCDAPGLCVARNSVSLRQVVHGALTLPATMLHTGHGMAAADPSKHGFFTDVKEMAKVLAGECQSHASCCVCS